MAQRTKFKYLTLFIYVTKEIKLFLWPKKKPYVMYDINLWQRAPGDTVNLLSCRFTVIISIRCPIDCRLVNILIFGVNNFQVILYYTLVFAVTPMSRLRFE